jgi:hypothetical protein
MRKGLAVYSCGRSRGFDIGLTAFPLDPLSIKDAQAEPSAAYVRRSQHSLSTQITEFH